MGVTWQPKSTNMTCARKNARAATRRTAWGARGRGSSLETLPLITSNYAHSTFSIWLTHPLETSARSTENFGSSWQAIDEEGGHPLHPNNRSGSLRRLSAQVNKLRQAWKLQEYDAITRDQLPDRTSPRAARKKRILQDPQIRDTAESTKMWCTTFRSHCSGSAIS